MSTQTTRFARPAETDDDWMLPDPPRNPDMLQHRQQVKSESMLMAHFKDRADFIVGGEGYLQRARRDLSDRVAPDTVVAFGVEPNSAYRRNGWVISEVGKPPDLVIEVASETTARRDFEEKPAIYARLLVPEMWMFDRTGGEMYPSALTGLILVDGVYRSIPINLDEDGVYSGWSEVLGLYVCWVEGNLRFYDPEKGEYLPDPVEASTRSEAAEVARQAEVRAREAAEVARQAEVRAREAAEARTREAEAEVARLHRLLQNRDE